MTQTTDATSSRAGEARLHIGKPHRRIEDRRFLAGRGRFTADIEARDAATAVFLRSPHAHARIRSLGTAKAASMPGVLAIVTGADWEKAGLGRLPILTVIPSTDGVERKHVGWPIIAQDRVRFAGEIVAMVVAEDGNAALDAAEAIEVLYEPLPAAVDTAAAAERGAPAVHEGAPSNVFFLRELGDRAQSEAVFAAAHHVVAMEFRVNRVTANAMEPRAALGRYDRFEERYTLFATHQSPHLLRRALAESVLMHPEHKIRVVSPDVGGGFGMKVVDYPETALVLWGARLADRPVRWISTRSEGLLSDAHGRDHATRARLALDREGRILAIESDTVANLGAYQTHRGATIPAYFYGPFLAGLYRTQTVYCRTRGIYSNTTPVHAYRGAGRPEAAYVVERLIDTAAREMGIDAFAIRERNLIPAEAFPYKTPVPGMVYDSGDPPALLARLKALCRYEALRQEQRALRAKGVLMGIGMALALDAMGAPSKRAIATGSQIGGWDSAVVRVHPSGKITAFVGTHSHGQGHATTFAQLAAERLKCPLDAIELVEGDTDRAPFGHGTYGSRSTVSGGMALVRASDRVATKARKIAAHVLECAEEDLAHDERGFHVVGSDRGVSFAEVARTAYHGGNLPAGMEPGLEEQAFYDPTERAAAAAAHLAVAIVDEATGQVRLRDYFAVDDCGTIINPMVLEGQIHGGLAQGIGQALMEDVTFDAASGQVLAGSFMDYAMPRADDLPGFGLASLETPSPTNAIGVKGGGESGCIGSLPAVSNAVVDALAHLGVTSVKLPMTAEHVWRAIDEARPARP